MELYLIDKYNNVVVYIVLIKDNGYIDIYSTVRIGAYTRILEEVTESRYKEEVVSAFEELSNIKDWCAQKKFLGNISEDNYNILYNRLIGMLEEAADKFELCYYIK